MNTFSCKVPDGVITLAFFRDNGVRVTLSPDGKIPQTLTVPDLPNPCMSVKKSDLDSCMRLEAPAISVEVENQTGRLRFFDANGRCILSEAEENGRQTMNEVVVGHDLVSRRQTFLFGGEDDSLHGLGHQMGAGWNFRGKSLDLLQENTTIVVPFLYGSAGFGILWDNASHSALGNPIRPIPAECWRTPSGEEAGLQAEYFTDAEFTNLKDAAIEPQVHQKWWAIVEGWHDADDQAEDAFHARWTGQLRPRKSGVHRLILDLPAGGRLWLDDKSVIDSRGSHKRHHADIDLMAGKSYSLRLEAAQGTTWLGAYAFLQWQEPIPSDRFSFWSQHAPAINYYVMAGSPDEIYQSYNQLTGPAPLMPRYVFGYWQSREHYRNKDELVGVVEEHRKRDIPIDVVVQDWRYWDPHTWGEPWFDPERFPDHPSIFRDLHERLNCHVMISNYAQIAEKAPLYEEFHSKGYLLDNAVRDGAYWIDPYNPDAVKLYWERTRKVYFDSGVDIFWLDTTEPKIVHPLTPESLLEGLTPNHLGDTASVLNAFSLYLCKGYYEAQREASCDRRVCLHPRSGFAGQQRYSAAVWTGDTEGNWSALKEQIQMALNMACCNIPYWNTDIGGFFGLSPEDKAYQELFIRWFQFAAFCPIMRNHGTNNPKEIWKFDPESEAILRQWIELHYQFLPYFYSLAWENRQTGKGFIRPLLMEFPNDSRAREVGDSFLLGRGILVCPVTEPGCRQREVCLPEGTGWYDFWTGEHVPGGQTVVAKAPMEQLPVFVREGTLLPLEPNQLKHTGQYTGACLELRIYPGVDGRFDLYEDAGDGYAYEQGQYCVNELCWDDTQSELSIEKTGGKFADLPSKRTLLVSLPGRSKVTQFDAVPFTERVTLKIPTHA